MQITSATFVSVGQRLTFTPAGRRRWQRHPPEKIRKAGGAFLCLHDGVQPFVIRIKADRVDECVEFLSVVKRLSCRLVRALVHAIGKEHNSFTTLDLRELFCHYVLESGIEMCTHPFAHAMDTLKQALTVVRRLAVYRHPVSERDHHYTIRRSQMVDEPDGCILDLIEFFPDRATRVEQQHHLERLVDGCEVGDLLLDTLLVDFEMLLCQIFDRPPIAILYTDGEDHEGGVGAQHFP